MESRDDTVVRYTLKDLHALADELGYTGNRQGTAATLDSLLDAFVEETGHIPVSPSHLLSGWFEHHRFVFGDEEDDSKQEEIPSEVQPPERLKMVPDPLGPKTPGSTTPPSSEGDEVKEPEAQVPQTPKQGVPPKSPPKAPKVHMAPQPEEAHPTPPPTGGMEQAEVVPNPETPKKKTPEKTTTKTDTPHPKKVRALKGAGPTPKGLEGKKAPKEKSLRRVYPQGRSMVSPSAAPLVSCSTQDLPAINLILSKFHRVELTPTLTGLRIKDAGRNKKIGSPEGRQPIRWTPEELEVIVPMKTQLKAIPLTVLLQMLKKEPIPGEQAKGLPSKARLIDLLRETKTDPETGEEVRCADSILRMRATILLLRAAAAKVTGRKVFY